MSAAIEIRNLRESDLDHLAGIYMRAFAGAKSESWTLGSARALVQYWLERQPDLAFVAVSNGVLAGAFIVGVKPWCDGNHLVEGEIFVDSQFQKRGIGKALISHTLKVAIEKYNPVEWETYTFKGDEFPLSWYQRIGFEIIDEWVMIRARISTLRAALSV